MEIRVKFLPGQQKNFLLKIQGKSGLHPDELAKIAGVVPRSFRDWRREKLCMSLKAADLFQSRYSVRLPENLRTMVLRWQKYKSEMGRRGGFAYFKKYGSPATPEGRRKRGI